MSKENRKASSGMLQRLSYNVERLRRGLSVGALGEACGLSKGHVSKLKNDQANVSLATLEALTAGFDCDVLDLFHRIPPQRPPIADDER